MLRRVDLKVVIQMTVIFILICARNKNIKPWGVYPISNYSYTNSYNHSLIHPCTQTNAYLLACIFIFLVLSLVYPSLENKLRTVWRTFSFTWSQSWKLKRSVRRPPPPAHFHCRVTFRCEFKFSCCTTSCPSVYVIDSGYDTLWRSLYRKDIRAVPHGIKQRDSQNRYTHILK